MGSILNDSEHKTAKMKDDPLEDMKEIEGEIEEAREKVQEFKNSYFKITKEKEEKPVKTEDDPVAEMEEIEEEIEKAREKVQELKDQHFKKK